MTSNEAVERLLNSPTVKIRHGSYLDIELIKSIKQDLERLEKFAHENASLHTEIDSLQSENEKLKKVIEILKDYLMLNVYINKNNAYCLDACNYAIPLLNKEQYDLLKEYL